MDIIDTWPTLDPRRSLADDANALRSGGTIGVGLAATVAEAMHAGA
jgi:hypothetical protein